MGIDRRDIANRLKVLAATVAEDEFGTWTHTECGVRNFSFLCTEEEFKFEKRKAYVLAHILILELDNWDYWHLRNDEYIHQGLRDYLSYRRAA